MSNLILANDTYATITDYVRLIDAEIGMFGYVTLTDGDFIVDEVFLVEQSVSGSSVDFADAGLDYAIQRAITDDRIDDLKFCCHSHVDMGAFWSKTDEDMIAGMNNGMTPYLVSLVINKRHETEQRVDFYNPPGEIGQFTDQLTFDLDLVIRPNTDEARQSEINALVTQTRYDFGYPRSRRRTDRTDVVDSDNWLPTTAGIPMTNAAGDIVAYIDDDSDFDDFDDLNTWSTHELQALAHEYYKEDAQ